MTAKKPREVQDEQHYKTLLKKAEKIGMPENIDLADYVLGIEWSIQLLAERIEKIEKRL